MISLQTSASLPLTIGFKGTMKLLRSDIEEPSNMASWVGIVASGDHKKNDPAKEQGRP